MLLKVHYSKFVLKFSSNTSALYHFVGIYMYM